MDLDKIITVDGSSDRKRKRTRSQASPDRPSSAPRANRPSTARTPSPPTRRRPQTAKKEPAPPPPTDAVAPPDPTPNANPQRTTRSSPPSAGKGTAGRSGGGATGGGSASGGTGGSGANAGGSGGAKGRSELFRGFELPATLKRQLVDDWEFVTKERKWVTLPRDPCVADLLAAWVQTTRGKKSGGSGTATGPVDPTAKEVADGLRDYFDAALGTMLLYRSERAQYNKYMLTRKARPCKVYGAEHLLRLFVKLPELIQKSGLDDDSIRTIGEKVSDICKFMQYNGRILFLIQYEPAR